VLLMRILQVCAGVYVSGRGGVSEHVMRISEGLVKRGHDVTVFATNSGELAWFEVVNGVKVRRFRRFAPGKAYFFSPAMIWALASADFDVVHAHGFHAFPLHFAFLAKCGRFVVTPHFHGGGHSVFRDCLFKLFRFFGKRTLLRADVVVAVSEFEKHLILEQFGFDGCKVCVVPNGVDFSEFSGLHRRQRFSRSILYVGRLESYKGVQYLVEILSRLPPDVVLEIVGRGPLRATLESRTKQLGLHNRVLFFQDLSRRELLQKYLDSDVFALLSNHEAYSLAVADALVSGIPCVVADTSGLSEWVDGEYCFGVDYPIKLDRLAEIISYVLRKGVSSGIALDKRFDSKILDWAIVAERIEKLYQ